MIHHHLDFILNVLLLVFIPFLIFLVVTIIFLISKSSPRLCNAMEGINQSIGPLLNAVGNSANALTSSSK